MSKIPISKIRKMCFMFYNLELFTYMHIYVHV